MFKIDGSTGQKIDAVNGVALGTLGAGSGAQYTFVADGTQWWQLTMH